VVSDDIVQNQSTLGENRRQKAGIKQAIQGYVSLRSVFLLLCAAFLSRRRAIKKTGLLGASWMNHFAFASSELVHSSIDYASLQCFLQLYCVPGSELDIKTNETHRPCLQS
jgi:hypothetical protein